MSVADCAAPHDDLFGRLDLPAAIGAWGAAVAGEPADTNATFGADVVDLLTAINRCRPCPPPPP